MLQSYKKIKYQHTKNQKKQEMEMPDNKQVSNLLKKEKTICAKRKIVRLRLIFRLAQIDLRFCTD